MPDLDPDFFKRPVAQLLLIEFKASLITEAWSWSTIFYLIEILLDFASNVSIGFIIPIPFLVREVLKPLIPECSDLFDNEPIEPDLKEFSSNLFPPFVNLVFVY